MQNYPKDLPESSDGGFISSCAISAAISALASCADLDEVEVERSRDDRRPDATLSAGEELPGSGDATAIHSRSCLIASDDGKAVAGAFTELGRCPILCLLATPRLQARSSNDVLNE